MSWVRVDDRFWCHPKVIRAGVEAIGLWLLACCWASTQETDGRLPADVLESIPGYRKPLANRLVSVGLWDEIEGGFQIHDYLEFNPSAADQQAKRAASAERMRRSRKRCAATDAQVAPELRVSDSAPSRSRPVPSRPLPQESTPAVAVRSPTAPAKRPAKSGTTPGGLAFAAYAEAYRQRYGTDPVRNHKVNIAFADLAKRLPAEEAPEVAAYYVTHNGALYVQSGHAPGLLLRDCEKLRTEWATGRQVNAETARRNEKTLANPFYQMAQELRRREEESDGEQEVD